MVPPEGKSPKINTISQNRLNAIKKIIKFDLNSRNGSRILGVTSGGLLPDTKF